MLYNLFNIIQINILDKIYDLSKIFLKNSLTMLYNYVKLIYIINKNQKERLKI